MTEVEREKVAWWLGDMALPIGGWRCFHTATFAPDRPSRTEFDAMDRYRRFMHERDRRKMTWVAAVEPNPDWSKLNPGFHLHAMWADLGGEIHRTPGFKRWANQWGNNKVAPVHSTINVADYVAKYCVKQNCMIEWEVNGELWHGHHSAAAVSPSHNAPLPGTASCA